MALSLAMLIMMHIRCPEMEKGVAISDEVRRSESDSTGASFVTVLRRRVRSLASCAAVGAVNAEADDDD